MPVDVEYGSAGPGLGGSSDRRRPRSRGAACRRAVQFPTPLGTVTSIQTALWSDAGKPFPIDEGKKPNSPLKRNSGSDLSGQKTLCVERCHVLAGQDVVGAQVAGRPVGEVGGVELRVAAVGGVGSTLKHGRLERARARRRELGVHERVVQQLLDRARDAVAVERVGVLVAGDDEERPRLQAAAATRVVVDVRTPAPGVT